MRNIDLPGAKEIFAKQEELMSTFWMNKAWIKANIVIHDEVRKDYVLEKMSSLRNKSASRFFMTAEQWYAKHSTVGDF